MKHETRILMKHLILLAVIGLQTGLVTAGPVYFLMAPRPFPSFCELGMWGSGAWSRYASYVVPLESPEDIAHCREVILRHPCLPRPSLHMQVAPGSDGMNQDHLALGASQWEWHIMKVDKILYDITFIPDPPVPEPHTLNDPEVMARVMADGGWIDQINTIVAELDPTLTAQMQVHANGDLMLSWDDLGDFYVFTVEQREIGSAGDWQPVPAVPWPIRENSWTIPAASLTPPARLYRVRAELQVPE